MKPFLFIDLCSKYLVAIFDDVSRPLRLYIQYLLSINVKTKKISQFSAQNIIKSSENPKPYSRSALRTDDDQSRPPSKEADHQPTEIVISSDDASSDDEMRF